VIDISSHTILLTYRQHPSDIGAGGGGGAVCRLMKGSQLQSERTIKAEAERSSSTKIDVM
jgi:hypothetical protein